MIVHLMLNNDFMVKIEMHETADIDLVDRNIRMNLATDGALVFIDKDDVRHFYPSRSVRYARIHSKETS